MTNPDGVRQLTSRSSQGVDRDNGGRAGWLTQENGRRGGRRRDEGLDPWGLGMLLLFCHSDLVLTEITQANTLSFCCLVYLLLFSFACFHLLVISRSEIYCH